MEKTFRAKSDSGLEIPISDLGREMVTQGWYTRRQFRLWFGHQDRLQAVIDRLGETCSLQPGAELGAVRSAVTGLPLSQIAKVLGFVPTVLLAPGSSKNFGFSAPIVLRTMRSDTLRYAVVEPSDPARTISTVSLEHLVPSSSTNHG
jgi:hypothetical protein